MNEIISLCEGYSRLDKNDNLFNLLEPFYKIEKSTPLLCATPWKMIHKNQSNIAVLALHGYQGFPGEMVYPGLELYNAGFDVFCPRYVGHGVTKEDFLKTNSDDWLNIARVSLGYLKKEYNEVYVIGHSMGGLIASIVSNEFEINKTVLISPAFFVLGFSYPKALFIKLFKNEIKIDWKMDKSFWGICERNEEDDAILGQRYWSNVNLNKLLELNKLRVKAINDLSKSKLNLFSIFGDEDKTIDANKSIKLLEKNNIETLLIKGSNHLCQYFNDESLRNLCNDSIVNFFKD